MLAGKIGDSVRRASTRSSQWAGPCQKKKISGLVFFGEKKNITAFFSCDVSVTALICLYLFSYLLANGLF